MTWWQFRTCPHSCIAVCSICYVIVYVQIWTFFKLLVNSQVRDGSTACLQNNSMSVTTEDTKVTASLIGARLLGLSACDVKTTGRFGSVFVLKNREHLDGSRYRIPPPPPPFCRPALTGCSWTGTELMRTEGNTLPSEEKQSCLKHAEKKEG